MVKVFLDINYHSGNTTDPLLLLKKFRYNLEYLNFLPDNWSVFSFNRIRQTSAFEKGRVNHRFYKGGTLKPWQIPFKYHREIKKIRPDYIIVHGMGYAFLAAVLKFTLSRNVILLVQSNGFSRPPRGFKMLVFKLAQAFIDGFLFTGKANAYLWTKGGAFSEKKIFEVMEGTTYFRFNPSIPKRLQSFIWVGRLDNNKDPLTILNAFEQYLEHEKEAKLTMIFNNDKLLNEVTAFLENSESLNDAVDLKGKITHEKLELLYQEHQFFLLGSHYEGSGYALVEAMTCGCVPIVTSIPSFKYMTANGECALLFTPGDVEGLLERLQSSRALDYKNYQKKVLKQVDTKLSYKAIAADIQHTFVYLASKKLE